MADSTLSLYRRILVPLDGSGAAEVALHYAEDLARLNRAELALLYLVSTGEPETLNSAIYQKHLFETQNQLAENGLRVQVRIIEKFAAPTTLLKVIEGDLIDLVVMASQGQSSMLRWTLGIDVEKALSELPVPLLLVRPQFHTIVVPLDGSSWSQRAVPKAAELARAHQAEIVLLHVYQSPVSGYSDQLALAGQQQIADQNFEQVHDQLISLRNQLRHEGLRAREHIIRSANPAQTIVEFVNAEAGPCMVVMSTHGRTGLARLLLGSVAQRVVRNIRCPVTLVRPDDA